MKPTLSIFPGIGLLDRAFEDAGFCVVRGPDVLWGGDIKRFNPPSDSFDGVIGGPPCQGYSSARWIRAAVAKPVNLIPEFERVVAQVRPRWFVMEEVVRAPLPSIRGYKVRDYVLENRWFGGEQMRRRRISFGSRAGCRLPVLDQVWKCAVAQNVHRAVLASDGKRNGRGTNLPDRCDFSAEQLTIEQACELQGLPKNFLEKAPFTKAGKYLVVGNGVPLFMGRAVAAAVKEVLGKL